MLRLGNENGYRVFRFWMVFGFGLRLVFLMEIGMKEYLNKLKDGTYKLVVLSDVVDGHDGLIEIPEGAEYLTLCGEFMAFWKKQAVMFLSCDKDWDYNYGMNVNGYLDLCSENGGAIVWQRQTHPEELPFIDDEPSLNDQYAEIETARQSDKVLREILGGDLPEFDFEAIDAFIESNVEQDNVNSPNHYKKGNVECIDAIQSSMTHGAFCGYLKGNIQKYMWRYEDKGGIESLEKAQWYLNKLIEVQNGNS